MSISLMTLRIIYDWIYIMKDDLGSCRLRCLERLLLLNLIEILYYLIINDLVVVILGDVSSRIRMLELDLLIAFYLSLHFLLLILY